MKRYTESLKSKRGVDFTKCALFAIQNAVKLQKVFFVALNSFMHIYNMSVTYLQSIERIH